MKISSSSQKTSARKPSHFGSNTQSSPGGSSSTRLASIGRSGGFTGRFTYQWYNGNLPLQNLSCINLLHLRTKLCKSGLLDFCSPCLRELRFLSPKISRNLQLMNFLMR